MPCSRTPSSSTVSDRWWSTQHRFGVEQRDRLRAKAPEDHPHLLVMTATPIRRTVA